MCLGNTCKPMHPKLEYLCTCLNYCLKISICDSSALSFINNNNFKNICTKAFQAWHIYEWFRLSKQMFVNQIHIKKTRKFPVSCNKINWLSSKCFLVSIEMYAKLHPSFTNDDSIESFQEHFDNPSNILIFMINLYFDLCCCVSFAYSSFN